MVVGMSVDYVVHLSEAYLASGKYSRAARTKGMLTIVGGSVLSGAASTLFGIMWLFAATVVIFYKFGAFIFFLIAVSCTFSLVSFSAAMSVIGPEGSFGSVSLLYYRIKGCIKKEDAAPKSPNTTVGHIEMQ